MYIQKVNEQELMILCLYVDDLVIIGSCTNAMESIKKRLKNEFVMTSLGDLSYFMGFDFVY